MAKDIAALIKKLSPLMDESSEVFRELSVFFGEAAKIPTDTSDLSKFLGRKRLYRVIRLHGDSYKDCVYQLVDDHPESMEALGMLRYYKSPTARIRWEEIEQAEIAMGKELTTSAYGWMPDAWTAMVRTELDCVADSDCAADKTATHELVAILAFDFGD